MGGELGKSGEHAVLIFEDVSLTGGQLDLGAELSGGENGHSSGEALRMQKRFCFLKELKL